MSLPLVALIALSLLLVGGCSMDNPSVASQSVTLSPGDSLSSGPDGSMKTYKLVRIDPDGKAVFHNADFPTSDSAAVASVQKKLLNAGGAPQDLRVGVDQSFGLETETRGRRTTHSYLVQSTDASKQQALVLVQVREN